MSDPDEAATLLLERDIERRLRLLSEEDVAVLAVFKHGRGRWMQLPAVPPPQFPPILRQGGAR